jgi:hypothetical protein
MFTIEIIEFECSLPQTNLNYTTPNCQVHLSAKQICLNSSLYLQNPSIRFEVIEHHQHKNPSNHKLLFVIVEKGLRIHQCPLGFGDEVRQVLLGLQANLEDPPIRQGKADHHRQQHSTFEVSKITEK